MTFFRVSDYIHSAMYPKTKTQSKYQIPYRKPYAFCPQAAEKELQELLTALQLWLALYQSKSLSHMISFGGPYSMSYGGVCYVV